MSDGDNFEERFKGLVSEHVDAQLGEHGTPPAFRPTGRRGGVVDIGTRRRRPWTLPLLAAACVALVVGGTAGAVNLLSEHQSTPATTEQPTIVDPTSAVPSPTGSGTRATEVAPDPTTSATSTSTSRSARTSTGAARGSSSSTPASVSSGSTQAGVSSVTVRVVVRPVHTDGTPVAGYRVRNETGDDGFSCFGTPSPVAVDPNIQYCGSSGTNTNACWKSTGGTALCLRDATTKVLVRIPLSKPFGSVRATQHPAPQLITLADASTCTIRNGGTGNYPREHPSWVLYYYCPHNTAVYGQLNDDGVDETVTPWTVVVFAASGAGTGHNRQVRTAYFVGTAT